jgi:hypothetical protein
LQAPFQYDDQYATMILDASSHAQTDLQGNILHILHATQPELQYLIYSIPCFPAQFCYD